MRSNQNLWLAAVLKLAFVVATGDFEMAFAQGARLQIDRNGETALGQPTAELTALLKWVEEQGDLERDSSGNVISLALRQTNANDRALFLASNIGSLRELIIQGRGRPDTGEWTRKGTACLNNLINLESLRILCVAPYPALQDGVFNEICNLKGLRSLSLVAACPERAEYRALTNLQNLSELRVSYATNFGDAELASLTNLVKLSSLYISFDAVSPAGTNVLAHMKRLTNATVRISKPTQF